METNELITFSNTILQLRYSHDKDNGQKESWEEISKRVVDNVFLTTPIKKDIQDAVYEIISRRKFIPGGRFLAQSGRSYHQVNNCFLLRAEDSREGWGELMHKATTMLMSGGGIGVDYSNIRERGAKLKRSGGNSSGPIPLMNVINEIGRGVMSGGRRRSAIWAGLRWNHPDIDEFIVAKNWTPEVRKLKAKNVDFPANMDMTNISIILDRDFFTAFNNGDQEAVDLYWKIINVMCKTGEPGFSVDYNNKNESLRNAPVVGDTYILTDKGYKKVFDVLDFPINIWTGEKFAPDVIFKKTYTNAPIIKVSMSGGRIIRCEENHEFFVIQSKWTSRIKNKKIIKVKAKDLKKNDNLLVSLPESFVKFTTPSLDYYTLGYIYGDGTFSNNHKAANLSLCTEESKSCAEYLQASYLSSITLNDRRGYTRLYYKTCEFLTNRYKDIFPKEVFNQSLENKASFIAGLWDSDGNFSRNSYRLSSIHLQFLTETRRLLESMGILSYVSKNGLSTYGKKQCYQLLVSTSYNQKFSDLIPTIRISKNNFSGYTSYREPFIRVEKIEMDGFEDVYCCDVKEKEHSFMAEGVIISNCGEIVSEEDCDVCCLGSINLPAISSIEELKWVTDLAILFLMCGTEYSDIPYFKIKEVKEKNRRLGLGLMGLHEWLVSKGYIYEPVVELENWLFEWREQSKISAKTWSNLLSFNEPIATRAIAPNGSISIAGGLTTSGIEPIFSVAFQRKYLTPDGWKKQYVIDFVAEKLIELGVKPEDIEDAYSLSKDIERRIRFQAFVQHYVDNAISSTINLPVFGTEGNDNPENFGKILLPFLPKLRGITVYPDGARDGQPLQTVDYEYAIKHKGVIFEGNENCTGGVCGI